MNVLFAMQSAEYLRFYDSTVQELAARGHRVMLAVNHERGKKPVRLEGVDDAGGRIVAVGLVPERNDMWAANADGLRGVMDFARYLHPRFASAPALRARMKRKALPRAFHALDRIRTLGAGGTRTLLSALGGEAARGEAAQWGVEDVVARYAAFTEASAAYDAARTAYGARQYDEALRRFDAACQGFEASGDAGRALQARRGRAWAEYNASINLVSAEAFAVYQRLVEEGLAVQDPELRVRAMGAVAVAAAELGRPEATASLRAATDAAIALGLRSQAARCEAVRADIEPKLADRITAANRAFELDDGGEEGRRALYSASVSAYNAGSYAQAVALAERALPHAGELTAAIREVLDAARVQADAAGE